MGKYRFAVLIAGASAVIGQTLIVREGLVLFSGNELTLGLMLGGWLTGTGMGSLLGGRFLKSFDPKRVLVALFLFLIAAFVFAFSLLIFAPLIFQLPYGEVLSLERMITICAIVLIPCGLALGAIFPVATRLIPSVAAYLYEGIGSFLGGFAGALILIPVLPSLGILAVLSVMLIAAVGLLSSRRYVFIFTLLPLVLMLKINVFDYSLRKIASGKRDLVATVETIYGRSSVFRSGRQYDFFSSGVYDFSYPDIYRAEAAVHYPMLLHPDPRRVLLVGGGMGGGRAEIYKHPSVQELVYAELDPIFYRWAEKFVPAETSGLNKYRAVFGDARLFIKSTTERFDAVILNLPDPLNGQLNRFYTREFFAEARRVLQPGGVLAVGVSAPPDIISPDYAEFLRTVRSALSFSFAWVQELPADRLLFVAADRNRAGGSIADSLIRRIAERDLKTLYIKDSYVRANLSPEKLNYYRRTLSPPPHRVNRDLEPICYYYAMVLWSGMGSNALKGILIGMARLNPIVFFLPILLVFIFFRRRSLIYVSLIASGAGSLALELVLMVFFQLTYGYVYGWLAALIAAFMAGLSTGAWLHNKKYSGRPVPIRRLSSLSLAHAGVAGLAVLAVALRAPAAVLYIPVLLFAGGLINGLYFSSVLGLLDDKKAGAAYALDLFGSSLAAVTVSVILIPLAGVVLTLLGLMALSLLLAGGMRTIK